MPNFEIAEVLATSNIPVEIHEAVLNAFKQHGQIPEFETGS